MVIYLGLWLGSNSGNGAGQGIRSGCQSREIDLVSHAVSVTPNVVLFSYTYADERRFNFQLATEVVH